MEEKELVFFDFAKDQQSPLKFQLKYDSRLDDYNLKENDLINYESNLFLKKLGNINSYEIKEFLQFHYDKYSSDKNHFLEHVSFILKDWFARYDKDWKGDNTFNFQTFFLKEIREPSHFAKFEVALEWINKKKLVDEKIQDIKKIKWNGTTIALCKFFIENIGNGENKLITSKSNLMRLLELYFTDSQGRELKSETLKKYFKPSSE